MPEPADGNSYKRFLKYIYFFAFFLILLFVIFRPLNHDETYYLISSEAVLLEGQVPYSDFVFHQMPLIIPAYMPVSFLGFWSLPAGRILSCIFFLGAFLILLRVFKSKFNNRQVFLFTVLYWFNLFLIDWAVTVKVYSLTIVLLSAGIYCYSKFLESPDRRKYLLMSSVWFSALIFTKIVFAITFLVFVLFTLYIYFKNRSEKKLLNIIVSLFAPPIILTVLFFGLIGSNFGKLYFDLFQINLINKDLTPFSEDMPIFIYFFILPQNLIVSVLAIFSLKNIDKLRFFLILIIVSFLLIHIQTRLLTEYNSSILPLIIILAVMGIENFLHFAKRFVRNFSDVRVISVLLITYCLLSPFSIYHIKQFVSSGKLPLNPVELHQFCGKLNMLDGETVLSSWEGLSVFSSKKTLFKENYAISYVSDLIDENTKRKYDLITRIDYKRLIDSAAIDIIIFDAANGAHLYGMEDAIGLNYKTEFEFNHITVYTRK